MLSVTDLDCARGGVPVIEGVSFRLEPGEAERMDRVCILFDGGDPSAVAAARDRWRGLTGAGAVAEYWSQEDGPWRMKMSTAEKGSPS